MRTHRKLSWLLWYFAVVHGLGVLLLAGLIPEWGCWYSPSPHYRREVDAMLQGSLAVSQQPSALGHDLAWAEGGVQQVWGLGVSLWRLPFEMAARACGQGGFPEMLALALAIGLVARGLLGTIVSCGNHGLGWNRARVLWLAGAAALVLFFPPFLNLLRSKFQVYEEVIAYEYLIGLGLAAGLMGLAQRPTRGRYWGLCWLAGVGGLFRPTLIFHGAAALVAGSLLWWWGEGHGDCSLTPGETPEGLGKPRAGKGWLRWGGSLAAGLALFALGGGLLFVTNLARFGNGFEFGHRLNVHTADGSLYATHFDDPYREESLFNAARELFGLMLLDRNLNGSNYYEEHFFPGQSPTVRWREMYLTTYDLSYLVLLMGGAGAGVLAGWRLWRARRDRGSPETPALTRLRVISALAVYGVLGSTFLLVFFLRNCVISSRYLLDWMPSFAAVILSGWLAWGDFWEKRHAGRWVLPASAVGLAAWLGLEFSLGRTLFGPPHPLTWQEVQAQGKAAMTPVQLPASGVYDSSTAAQATGMPYNGAGWKADSGMVMPCVILFVDDPIFLELDMAGLAGQSEPSGLAALRAKVGLEYLQLEALKPTTKGWRVRFAGPKQSRYRHGLQVVFLTTVTKTHLVDEATAWQLQRVCWK